jgi:hypothetical protein
MGKFKKVIILLTFLIGDMVVAHGEDKAGPHGGSIRMPGAFHTEVVLVNKNQIKVFLLDSNWENPSSVDSSVSVTFNNGKKAVAQCEKKENAFICTFDSAIDLKTKGKLLVTATREKQKGNVAEYATPLKF